MRTCGVLTDKPALGQIYALENVSGADVSSAAQHPIFWLDSRRVLTLIESKSCAIRLKTWLMPTKVCATYLPAESPARRKGSRDPVVRTRKKKKKSDNNNTTPVVDDTAVLVARAKGKNSFPQMCQLTRSWKISNSDAHHRDDAFSWREGSSIFYDKHAPWRGGSACSPLVSVKADWEPGGDSIVPKCSSASIRAKHQPCVRACVCACERVCFKLPPPKQAAQTRDRGRGKKNVNRKMRRSPRAVWLTRWVHALGNHINIHAGLPGRRKHLQPILARLFIVIVIFLN